MSAQESADKRRTEAQYQSAVKNFEAAARYFQKQSYDKAEEIFKKLAEGPIPEIAERARVHLRLCQQKLRASAPAPKSAEDYYNLGVAELNLRNFEQALEYLNKADKMTPNQEHIRYALAAVHARQGNVDLALEHLKAAIALRPENRTQARLDEDFASVAADPRFKRLISPAANQAS